MQLTTSYAQNHEDVLLDRCFRDQPEGFYVDVGAWDPVIDSVTQHFYVRGWRGINIEPTLEFFEHLREQRPRDINLRCAVTDAEGTAHLRLIQGSGLSTLRDLDPQFREDLEEGGFISEVIEVPATTLARICAEHVPDGVEIDFLKIDVEGAESAVLIGADWKAYRPKVLVIESILPVVLREGMDRPKPETTSHEWDSFIREAGYLFAANDGVNRFYVREEDPHLLDHFRTPVNVLDLYVSYSERRAQEETASIRGRLDESERLSRDLSEDLATIRQLVDGLEAKIEDLNYRIADLVTSTSWRVTAPMRAVTNRLHRRT